MTTGPVTRNPHVDAPPRADPIASTQPPAPVAIDRGDLGISHISAQEAGAPLPAGHDIDAPASPVTGSQKDQLAEIWSMDLTPSLDLVSLMGDLVDKLKRVMDKEKHMIQGERMQQRIEQRDLSLKAADDEESLGKTALAWSIINGASQIAVGGASMGVGIKTGDMGMTHATSQLGSGLTAPLGGAEKLVESDIKARQERHQADAQMAGGLQQDLDPQDIKDAIKDALQHYAHVSDKADQGRETIIGNFR